MKKAITITTYLAIALTSSLSWGLGEFVRDRPSAVNADRENVAMKGYDPVSYFDGKPAAGKESIVVKQDGFTYRFASKDNAAKFQQNPKKYMPAFGGFCANGVVSEKKLDVDPTSYLIVDGVIYFTQKSEFSSWRINVDGNIKKAFSRWPDISRFAPSNL